jgi:hypothetical protein
LVRAQGHSIKVTDDHAEAANIWSKSIVGVVFVLILLLIGAKFTVRTLSPPSCHSDQVVDGLAESLKYLALGTLAINDAETISGGFLSTERGCSADLASIRTGLDAEHMHWLHVNYQVREIEGSRKIEVTTQVIGPVPLAPVHTYWGQWLEFFAE